jgi:hypothetical protein
MQRKGYKMRANLCCDSLKLICKAKKSQQELYQLCYVKEYKTSLEKEILHIPKHSRCWISNYKGKPILYSVTPESKISISEFYVESKSEDLAEAVNMYIEKLENLKKNFIKFKKNNIWLHVKMDLTCFKEGRLFKLQSIFGYVIDDINPKKIKG